MSNRYPPPVIFVLLLSAMTVCGHGPVSESIAAITAELARVEVLAPKMKNTSLLRGEV